MTFPVDTGRKLNVHKTFRRRPGRLLNILCTFNLRPVSTGLFELSVIRKCLYPSYFSVFHSAFTVIQAAGLVQEQKNSMFATHGE